MFYNMIQTIYTQIIRRKLTMKCLKTHSAKNVNHENAIDYD